MEQNYVTVTLCIEVASDVNRYLIDRFHQRSELPTPPCSTSPLVLQYTFLFVRLLTLLVPFCNI